MAEDFDAAYWESRYQQHAAHGGRTPHPFLVEQVESVPAGSAADVGCGEGGNAIWLAQRGWRVTAVDVASTALRRARGFAEQEGPDVAGRMAWVEADLTVWEPPREQFDLVTAFYVHPAVSRQAFLDRLASAVAPGGRLLVVDHDHSDEHARVHSSVGELSGCVPDGWEIEVAETRMRLAVPGCAGGETLHDVLLSARRP